MYLYTSQKSIPVQVHFTSRMFYVQPISLLCITAQWFGTTGLKKADGREDCSDDLPTEQLPSPFQLQTLVILFNRYIFADLWMGTFTGT